MKNLKMAILEFIFQVVVQLLPGQRGFPRPLRPIIRLSQMATINTIKRWEDAFWIIFSNWFYNEHPFSWSILNLFLSLQNAFDRKIIYWNKKKKKKIECCLRYLAMSMWKKVSRYNEIDLFCNNELMGKDFSMRFIQLTRCRDQPKTKPVRLYYKKHIEY